MDSKQLIKRRMNTKKYLNKLVFTIVLVCSTTLSVTAQEDFGDDTDDTTPAANVDVYTPMLLVAAIGLGYFLCTRRAKVNR